MEIRNVTKADAQAIIELWQACDLTRPWNDPDRDIQRKLEHGSPFWAVWNDQTLIASVMFDYDGHRGSVNYLAVSPDCQGKGVGRWLMGQVEGALTRLGCPKLNLMVRSGNSACAFYQALSYQTDPVVVLSKRLIPDD